MFGPVSTPRVSARPGHKLRHSNTSPLVMLNASFAAWGDCAAQTITSATRSASAASPDERRTARKTERFTLLAADCRVDTDSRENVQRARGGPGDELRTQCRVVEAVLGAHLTHIVLVVEEEVLVVLTGITFAGRDGDRVQVHAVDLRSLHDTDVLEIGGGVHDRFHHVAEHGVVGLDLFLARPASDQLGLLVYSPVGDVSDVRHRLERAPSS